MSDVGATHTIREAVAVFETHETLQDAADELMESGFDRSELGLLAGEDAVEEKLGHIYKKVEELEDDSKTPRVAYMPNDEIGDAEGALIGAPLYIAAVTVIGIVVATGGTLAAAIGAGILAGGSGALVGNVLANMVEEHHAEYLQEQLDKGGFLLWVRTRDAEHEAKAQAILSKHSSHDVHIHDLPVGA
jgi:hypothetical protein